MRMTGAPLAIGAALLFGAGTPLSKLLLGQSDPWVLAGLLYLGSGVGLAIYRLLAGLPRPDIDRSSLGWTAGAVVSGGVIAPVLLMFALRMTSASSVSLLLNAEGVFTALLAGLVFKEHIGRRIAFGMLLIALGAVVLSWPTQTTPLALLPSVLALAACLAWAIDNNLTRRAADIDATWIAATKGIGSGIVNLALALLLGKRLPAAEMAGLAMLAGLMTYGVSLVMFVLALRQLGTARTGAYFSTAPFVGALLALAMGEPATLTLLAAGLLMGVGVWLHLTERHEHEHEHGALEHTHEHVHDVHHDHPHDSTDDREPHVHLHRHAYLRHKHPHFPDSHHQHRH